MGLDAEHEKLIDFLRDNPSAWSWNQDHHMLVTHTYWLREAHKALGFKGTFETSVHRPVEVNRHQLLRLPPPQRGLGRPPLRQRNGRAPNLEQGPPGLHAVLPEPGPRPTGRLQGAGRPEDESGGFAFPKASEAVKAAAALGAKVELPPHMLGRKAKLRKHKDGRLIVEILRNSDDSDSDMTGWTDKGKVWVRIFDAKAEPQAAQEEVGSFDSVIRHLVTDRGKDAGWAVCSDQQWREEAKDNAAAVLIHLGVKKQDVTSVIGSCVLRPWTLVRQPFEA